MITLEELRTGFESRAKMNITSKAYIILDVENNASIKCFLLQNGSIAYSVINIVLDGTTNVSPSTSEIGYFFERLVGENGVVLDEIETVEIRNITLKYVMEKLSEH